MPKIFQFESKLEKYLLFSITGIVLLMIIITFFPESKAYINEKLLKKNIEEQESNSDSQSDSQSKSPKEYYKMFQCPCCGQTIDSGCCDMAKQRKDYIDNLLQEELSEEEIFYRMVKKFGTDVLVDKSKEEEIKNYIKTKGPANPPKIELDKTRFDFGTIKQTTGIISTLFNIKNTGESDLIIDNLDSSCMCTSASIIYKGQEGPRFGMSMHGSNPTDYKLVIPPGETAQLKVYYDPMAHGKQKKPSEKITREISIFSNDPINFEKKVIIELTQTP